MRFEEIGDIEAGPFPEPIHPLSYRHRLSINK